MHFTNNSVLGKVRKVSPRSIALLVLVSAFAFSTSVMARHRHHMSGSALGQFDYYVLSLSWSPAFCLQSPDATECRGPRHYGFIVHGLWPQREQGWPENCAGAQLSVPDPVAQSIADVMPSRGLIDHEWSAHGTCSGLDPDAYFALVRRAFQSVVIPAQVARPAREVEEAPAAIIAQFLQSNPAFQPESAVVICSGQSVPRLREVRLCLSRDLAPRACSAQALRQACRAPSVIVPPIR